MQVIFAMLVLVVAALAFLVFLVLPPLRRHALKAVAAVFGFAAGSVGSMFASLVIYGLSGLKAETLPVSAQVTMAILWNCVFWGGGVVCAWIAVLAVGWVQARLLAGGR